MGNNISYIPKNKKSNTKKRPGENTYKINGKDVYWRGQKINADGKTFEHLKYNYGKDTNYIFWSGKIIITSPSETRSFICLKNYHAQTDHNIYYKGHIIDTNSQY